MRNIFFALLLIITTQSFAQNIPPKVNVILVKGVSFMQVCNALLDSNYKIEKKDIELQTATTEAREYPKYWNATYKINIRVKDSIAYISATFTAPPEGGLFKNEPVENNTNKKGETRPKSMDGYIFLLINNFASNFKKEVSYQKKQN